MENQDKRTASQKIEDMERGLMALYQAAETMARDVMTIKEAIKLLGNKVDAITKCSVRGQSLTDDNISSVMVENNVDELKSKVTDLMNQGILVTVEEATQNSFVVGQELSDDGKVQNPRLQFVVSSLDATIKDKFTGAKVGDLLNLQEGKLKLQVLEIYSINTPQQAPEAATTTTTDTTAQATTTTADTTPATETTAPAATTTTA